MHMFQTLQHSNLSGVDENSETVFLKSLLPTFFRPWRGFHRLFFESLEIIFFCYTVPQRVCSPAVPDNGYSKAQIGTDCRVARLVTS